MSAEELEFWRLALTVLFGTGAGVAIVLMAALVVGACLGLPMIGGKAPPPPPQLVPPPWVKYRDGGAA